MNAKKILLPKVPDNIIQEIYNSITNNNEAFTGFDTNYSKDVYGWYRGNQLLQDWCQQNISPDIFWGVQVITGDLPIHKDLGSESKFNYIVEPGGGNVITYFYDDNDQEIESINLEAHEWYILNVSVKHNVKNVKSTRISITGRIHP